MFLERIEDHGLSQYSYAVGCEGAGLMVVVDPRRDIDVYLELAAAHDSRITHVLESHIHADFASGARELAQRTGASLALSAYDAGELYESKLPHAPLRDGDSIVVGSVILRVRHTPGHTPEHLAFLVYDTTRSSASPMVMLSGDFLFVGSLGRPDLLGDEAKRGLARRLYQSVREKLADLPDGLEIAPGHGAGSMCGAGMSGRAVSTLGFERLTNPYLRSSLDESSFVTQILANVPPFPPYYRRMKQLNAAGAAILGGLPGQTPVPVAHCRKWVGEGYVVVDLRDQLAFGAGHVPGAFGIALGSNLSTWAAWVVPYERPILLVAQHPDDAAEAARALVRVGLDDVRGHLAGGIDAWIQAGLPLAQTAQWSVSTLANRMTASEPPVRLIDVRSEAEWDSGHVPGAEHLMGGFIADRVDDLRDVPGTVALMCRTGYRSTVAASLLERAGITNVVNITGGYRAWTHAGLPFSK